MKLLPIFNKLPAVVFLFVVFSFAGFSHATTVLVQTSEGDFVINLFDFDPADPDNPFTPDLKPTVNNFLAYVNAGAYDNTFFHRLSSGFVLQGGGYVYDGSFPEPQPATLPASGEQEPGLTSVVLNPGEDNPTVNNQPRFSNVRGTLAMAKVGGDPNSATNQWFINLADNSSNLDLQNSGFTVFGRVMGDGMDVVDALADYTLLSTPTDADENLRYDYNPPLDELPLRTYTVEDFEMNLIPTDSNLAMITSMTVVDGTQNTETEADLIVNELILGFRTSPRVNNDQYQGGSVGYVFLVLLTSLAFFRRRFFKSFSSLHFQG